MSDSPKEKIVEQWLKEQPIAKASVSLSLVIPAYNEYRRLPVTLMETIDYLDHCVSAEAISSYEIIVVDDGSSDKTAETVQKFCKIRPQVHLIRIPDNHGKGHAVRVGVLNALGEKILFADADGASPIHELERLSREIEKGSAIAIGSRAARSLDTKVKTAWYRKYMGRCFNLAVNLLVVPGIKDTQCGFKMFTAQAAKFIFTRQSANGFSFDVEVLLIAQKAGLKISEVPINWSNVPGSKVNLVLDSLRMLRDIFIFKVRHRAVTPQEWLEFSQEPSEKKAPQK